MPSRKQILVVGSGASGLPSIKSCKEEGFDVVCYEKTDGIGGVWRYSETSIEGEASVMKTTVANSSKEMHAFSDFPPPVEFPIYLPHKVMLRYFELYAEQFDLTSSIMYHHEVMSIHPAEDFEDDGKWMVKVLDHLSSEVREEIFDGVMICTGHHSHPLYPSYCNMDLFAGKVLHSHEYKTYKGFENKVVAVIGAGSSGADIAVELANIAEKVYLSCRRGFWLYPRYLGKGKPIDSEMARRYLDLYPRWMMERKMRKLLNSVMDHKIFGIQPSHDVLSQHPTVNDELQSMLASSKIIFKKDVTEFTDLGVYFEGEKELTRLDVVIFATGYKVKFPFIDDSVIEVDKNNSVFLYQNVFPPQLKHPSLAIIGNVQPNGGLFPVFEMQARWYASLMAGRCKLPSNRDMMASVRKMAEFRSKHFVQSSRYAIEVYKTKYMDDIADAIGAKPNMTAMMVSDPKLFWACFKGPLLPYHYRLGGLHKWEGARQAILSYKSRMYHHMKAIQK